MTSTTPEPLPALGICLEEYEYPYPVRFLPLTNDLQQVSMAYMDVPPGAESNGKTVVLMHGKAFGGYYFRNVIEALAGSGYRVVVPDQIGWGKSPKPDVHYSFQLLAANTAALLEHKVWESLADVLVRVTLSADYPRWARAAALTFQMIYQQPVRYEATPASSIPTRRSA